MSTRTSLRAPVKLALAALVAAVPVMWYLFASGPYVNSWASHSSLESSRGSVNQVGGSNTDRRLDNSFELINGTHFISDYDVNAVIEPPMSQYTAKPGSTLSFQYPDHATSKYKFRTLSLYPRIVYLPDFLTDEECDTVIALANKTMTRSKVTAGKTHDTRIDQNGVSDVRTSTQTWLNTNEAPAKPIVDRLVEFTGMRDFEQLQILHYGYGEQYIAHTDYFPTRMFGPMASNRVITCFLYFSTVEEGGETQFPRADGKPMNWDFRSCKYGLRVKPIKRAVACFYDMLPDGRFDAHSLHGGCPPRVGEKWGGTLWFHINTPMTQIAEYGV